MRYWIFAEREIFSLVPGIDSFFSCFQSLYPLSYSCSCSHCIHHERSIVWCSVGILVVTGEGQGDSETVPAAADLHHQQASAVAGTVALASAKPRGKRRGATVSRDNGVTVTMNGATNTIDHHHNNNNNNNNNNNPLVKTERLSPSATTSSTTPTTTTTVTGSGPGNATSNTPDNNSSSSRSATPSSSYPGTPPGSLTAERAASPSSSPAGQFKHMEQMMSRNYSDFMRSLAAKYNNANPNE